MVDVQSKSRQVVHKGQCIQLGQSPRHLVMNPCPCWMVDWSTGSNYDILWRPDPLMHQSLNAIQLPITLSWLEL